MLAWQLLGLFKDLFFMLFYKAKVNTNRGQSLDWISRVTSVLKSTRFSLSDYLEYTFLTQAYRGKLR